MPPIRIPQRYRPGLAAVAELTEEETQALSDALSDAPAHLAVARLAERARNVLADTSVDAEALLEAVVSLVVLLPEDGAGADVLARDVSEADIEIGSMDKPAYASRLEALMHLRSMALTARATGLSIEHERMFHSARFLTDMRPVFNADVKDGLQAAAITTSMKLEFHPGNSGDIETIFVGFSRADLEYLQIAVERSLGKVEQLEMFVERAKLPYWDEQGHQHDAS